MAIGDAFDASVAYYDDWIRIALPGYEELFGTAVGLIPFESAEAFDVLDLGAGTGLFSKHVFDAFPNARFTLVDLAAKLLDVAGVRFADRAGQFSYVTADYRAVEAPPQYDVVVSSLSIHHLTDAEKADLFRRVYGLLRPGGVFLNIDQIRAESPRMEALYRSRWLEHVRRLGATEQQIADSLDRRDTYDRDAFLGDQLRWLREAGFKTADCIYKNWFVGVFFAERSGHS
ncbi:MAG TPA: methyltransferase domain-containing protein [Candidatus Limnocylindrales bacterium]